jgi:hypothetical protein
MAWLDRLFARIRRARSAPAVFRHAGKNSGPGRLAPLLTDIEAALEARRMARPERQQRARKSARTKFSKRMEGLKQWPTK